MKAEHLEWDSNFFKCSVGRLVVDADQDIAPAALEGFDLVYVIVENELPAVKKKSLQRDFFLADEKLTYQKTVTDLKKPNPNIFSWDPQREVVKDLLDIAVQSGEFSRFRVDPNIPNSKFVELYEMWIVNSVKRLIAEEVYYFSIDDRVGGIITLSIKGGNADIGILSVNRIFRGRGIATELVHAAEYWAKNMKRKDSIQVVTQASNIVACRFYEKCGFRIEKKEYVFHWWRHKGYVKDPF